MIHTYFSEPPVPKPKKSLRTTNKNNLGIQCFDFPGISVFFFKAIFPMSNSSKTGGCARPWQDQGISLEGPLEVRKMHNEEAVWATQRSGRIRYSSGKRWGNDGKHMGYMGYRNGKLVNT